MSTIKSSNEDITLNADGAGKEIKFQANGVEKASIDSSGNFTSTSIDATKLSGALPAIDGSNLTNLPAGGKVLQVVSIPISSSGGGTNSSSYIASDITATITPSAISSKIFIMVTSSVRCDTQSSNKLVYTLYKGATDLSSSGPMGAWVHNDNSSVGSIGECSLSYLDSPNTTSATTYKVYYKSTNGGWVRMPDDTTTTGIRATITLMEIAG